MKNTFKIKDTSTKEVFEYSYEQALKLMVINERIKGNLVLDSKGYVFQNGDIIKDAVNSGGDTKTAEESKE